QFEEILKRELGERPPPELAGLVSRISLGRSTERQREVSDLAKTPVWPLPGGRRAGSGLPVVLTRFFGRTAELKQLVDWAACPDRTERAAIPARLITLVGSGGGGKTRLAIEAGRRIAERAESDVFFARMADCATE